MNYSGVVPTAVLQHDRIFGLLRYARNPPNNETVIGDDRLGQLTSYAAHEAVFLYGNRAEGTAKPDSDVILALSIKGLEAT